MNSTKESDMNKIKVKKIGQEKVDSIKQAYATESFDKINGHIVEITIDDENLLSDKDKTFNYINLFVKIQNKKTGKWVMFNEKYARIVRIEEKKGGGK